MYSEDSNDYDMVFKIIVIGDSGVGKTNLLTRYTTNTFNIDTKSTVGVEFGSKRIIVNNGTIINTQIWDTAGQERYRSITNAYYKGSKGGMIVFDITKRNSFDNVDRWVDELKLNGEKEIVGIIIGNKSDLEMNRTVSKEEGKLKADKYEMAYIETSAMHSVFVDKAFEALVEGKIVISNIYKYSKLFIFKCIYIL